jgi:hypothetical protein
MVLRYAVPALGLVVVAMIGLTVFRRGQLNSSPEMVATSRKAETPAVAQETKPQDNYVYGLQDKTKAASPVPEEPRRGRIEAEPPAPVAAPAANTPTDLSKEAPVAKTESTTVATAAAPPAAPKPAETKLENKTPKHKKNWRKNGPQRHHKPREKETFKLGL